MRVVALVPGGIDQQLMVFPTLDQIKANYPEATIDVVVEPEAKPAYRISKTVREVVPFDFQARNSLADWGNLLGTLRDREYEVALSFSPKASIGFLLWLTGIPTRVGYQGTAADAFLTNSIAKPDNQYAALTAQSLLGGLGITPSSCELGVALPAKDLDWAEGERKRLGLATGSYLLIHNGGADPYPVENWQGLIKAFQQKQPDFPIVIAQAGAQSRAADDFAAQVQAGIPGLKLTQPADLGKLAAMIAGASLVISPDGPALYLAVAVQTYCVGLFGTTEPSLRIPMGDRVLGIKSLTGKLADISPQTILEKVMGGA
jgi:ADP-heptose:LPS heptosyltransferase